MTLPCFANAGGVCYPEIVKRFLTIGDLLTVLAVLGLLLSPLARPTLAMASSMDVGAMAQGDTAAHAAMDMADMPCCPDSAPKSDCAKDCPLMALCGANTFQSAPHATGPVVSLARARTVVPGNDASLDGFAQAPLPRPPDV
jgi:hypothetical protein